ncbi:MAG: hypothetical protein ACJ73S_11430 [Mycobacteriales bacterium]
MTSRLLTASLGSPTYDGMRDTLRTGRLRPVVSAGGVEVLAQPLPLFRRREGALSQAVRLVVRAPGGAAVTLTLSGPDGEYDRAAVEIDHGEEALDLYVPEVAGDREVTVTVSDHGGAVGAGTVTVTPQRKWSVYAVHHSHLDIGYTDRQGVVLRNHLEYLDSALDLAAATGDWDDDARFRWTVESALPVRRWLAARPAAVRDRFVELAMAGRIEVTAMPFQLHTEACSTEELHRLLRFADDLRAEYGIPITSAMHTDVPGAVVGFVDALAAAGVRYLSAAHNWAGRSVPYLVGGQRLGRPFWWRAPSGNRVLVWFTDTPHGMAYMEGNVVGLADDWATTLAHLPGYLDALAHEPFPYGKEAFGWSGLDADQVSKPPYPHDLLHLRVQGGHADNACPSIVPASVARRWNDTYAWPRIRMATNTDFFTAAEERLGDRLPEHTGDWTDWWADGLGSGARPLGYARRAQHALRHAETLHSLAGADADVDAVYDKLGLFDEHTWGAANPWQDAEDGFDSGGLQWARKCELAYQAADDTEDLRHAGARRLGARYPAARGTLAGYLVVNPGAARSDVVEAFLPASVVALDVPVEVRDARGGAVVPHHEEAVRPEEWPTRPAGRRLSWLARDLPALGYARFDVVRGGGPVDVVDLGRDGVVESERYRVEYDLAEGYLASVFDKVAGRELVNRDALAGMNQYVHDAYATAPHFNHLSGHIEATGEDNALLGRRSVAARPSVARAVRTAVGERLEVALDGIGVDWLRTTVSLPAGVDRVDLVNGMGKQGAPGKESVFFAFPFAAGAPVAWELTGGLGSPAGPVVPGAARHMTPIRHWVGYGDAELAVAWATLEAPLVMFGDLYLPYAPFPPTLRADEPGTVYSWALNNIWDTNFPAQQRGETTFRYALSSGAGLDPAALGVRTAAGLTDPFVAVPLTGTGPEETPPDGAFVTVDDPRVQVSSLARSRRGHDLAVYLRSVTGEDISVEVSLPGLRRARVGSSLERDLTELSVVDGTVRVPVPAGNLVALAVDLAVVNA